MEEQQGNSSRKRLQAAAQRAEEEQLTGVHGRAGHAGAWLLVVLVVHVGALLLVRHQAADLEVIGVVGKGVYCLFLEGVPLVEGPVLRLGGKGRLAGEGVCRVGLLGEGWHLRGEGWCLSWGEGQKGGCLGGLDGWQGPLCL